MDEGDKALFFHENAKNVVESKKRRPKTDKTVKSIHEVLLYVTKHVEEK